MKKIKIGKQIWSKRNLKVSHYRNGDIIPHVKNREEWSKLTTGAWCYFKNKKKKKYGKLYNWYAVNDPRGLAPEGWHIPTKEEFEKMLLVVNDSANSLKSKNVGEGDGTGTNESGFSSLVAGCRYCTGKFSDSNLYAYYWSSTEIDDETAYNLYLLYDGLCTYMLSYNNRSGYSVRLIKD